MNAVSYLSDKYKQRGLGVAFQAILYVMPMSVYYILLHLANLLLGPS